MFARLLLPIVLVIHPSPQNPVASDQHCPVVVTSSRWFKDRQSAEKVVVPARGPELPMIEPIGREQRADGTAPVRDPNAEKPEARSASLDRIAEESGQSRLVNGFTYEVKFKNLDTRQAQTIFWDTSSRKPRHQKILPDVGSFVGSKSSLIRTSWSRYSVLWAQAQ